MDCREFRNKHVAYVDDLLPVVEMDAMQRHAATCPRCSRRDVGVRRSLMLVRSLPPIEPSPDFMRRLNARLEELGPQARVDTIAPRPYFSSVGAFTALAAGIAAVAYMAIETAHYYSPDPLPSPVPMASALPQISPEPMANAALVASVPTAMPVWPAVLMASQAPMEFANLELRQASLTR